MMAASSMALSECVRSWNRWPPGLASQRLRTPNRTPRRSRAPSFAWRSRRIGVSTLGRGHCPSTSPGRPPTARCCPLGMVLGPGVHRLSQASAAGEWWQQSAAGSATARSARRNGRACGPAPAVGGAKGARAAAILRTPREDEIIWAPSWQSRTGLCSGPVSVNFSRCTRTASLSTNPLIP